MIFLLQKPDENETVVKIGGDSLPADTDNDITTG